MSLVNGTNTTDVYPSPAAPVAGADSNSTVISISPITALSAYGLVSSLDNTYPTLTGRNDVSLPIVNQLSGFNQITNSWERLRTSEYLGVLSLKGLRPSSSTITNINITNTNTTLINENSDRLGLVISNDGSQNLYMLLDSKEASSTNYSVMIPSNGYYQLPHPTYTGQINGIWASTGSGAARITEMTNNQSLYVVNYDFTNATSNSIIYTLGKSFYIPEYTCASGSRYCQYSTTQVASDIGVDQAPMGIYGIAFWGGITNLITNPLTETGGSWSNGTATRTTGIADPAGGTAGFRDVATIGQYSNNFPLSTATTTSSVFIKTDGTSVNRWSSQNTKDPTSTLTSAYNRRIINSTSSGPFIMEGRAQNGYTSTSAFDITHAFPQVEAGKFPTDFHNGTRAGARFSIAGNRMPNDGRLRLYIAIYTGCSIGSTQDSTTALNIAAAGTGYSITAHQTTGVITVTTNSSSFSTTYGNPSALNRLAYLEWCIEVGGGKNTIVKLKSGNIIRCLGVSNSPQADWSVANSTDILCSGTDTFPCYIRKIQVLSSGTVFTGEWS